MINNFYAMRVAISSAVAAGNVLLNSVARRRIISQKESSRDILTNIDIEAEEVALRTISEHYPHTKILSEESGISGNVSSNDGWIVDALDGTVNYMHDLPLYSVSIAYLSNGKLQASCIYLPHSKELYYAARGEGAFKNQYRVHSPAVSFSNALFAASFSGVANSKTSRRDEYLAFGEINDSSSGCLRTGSAALNLAYLSVGRFNGCWGMQNKIWDIAAGILIAEEAGAIVRLSDPISLDIGSPFVNFIAAPHGLHEKLLEYLKNPWSC